MKNFYLHLNISNKLTLRRMAVLSFYEIPVEIVVLYMIQSYL